jgi:hypothetical protein
VLASVHKDLRFSDLCKEFAIGRVYKRGRGRSPSCPPSQGRILEIRSMKPFDKTYISSISSTVAYALEVNSGWFDRHGVGLGARIYGMPPEARPR